ncbi:hypothetical protein CEXT_417961 [Caerostris extrusa]|uniref:Uncharacterized protein n=1 Tax=Caerostris extrusa TaxID=172846 RepID=A0AAV4SBW3_CAEEX|nr:hypothetical protein CEXT_417961 [Caerostris extrusa]
MRSCGTAEDNNGFALIEKRIEDYYEIILNLSFRPILEGEKPPKDKKMIPSINYAWRLRTSWGFYILGGSVFEDFQWEWSSRKLFD